MTPTEKEVLAPYERIEPVRLAGAKIVCTYYDGYSFIALTADGEYVKIRALNDEWEGTLETDELQAVDLKLMGKISGGTWKKIVAERSTNQKARRLSDVELAVRRLVKEYGVTRIQELIEEVE
jgi:hypothetical protein